GGRSSRRTRDREDVGKRVRRIEQQGGFSEAWLWCPMGERGPPSTRVVGGRFGGAHRHTVDRVILWSGCVPAEPASVSPGAESVAGNGSGRQARLLSGSGKVIVVGLLPRRKGDR